ncbi:MAG: hypothetical protein ABIK81_03080 [candidate division WOR-3 bacterium]
MKKKRERPLKKELTCQDVESILFEYFDKEIEEKILYQIERHRMSCVTCTKLIKSYRLVIKYLKIIGEEDVPEVVHRKLLMRIEDVTSGKLKSGLNP